jgi:hypothetical protein
MLKQNRVLSQTDCKSKHPTFLVRNASSLGFLNERMADLPSVSGDATFLSGKLRLVRKNYLEVGGDVLVVPTYPEILSG